MDNIINVSIFTFGSLGFAWLLFKVMDMCSKPKNKWFDRGQDD